MYLEWSGQFEHQVRARRTLSVVFPLVIVLIFLILYITYHDFVDTLLVMGLAVPGAIAGGVLFQFIFGFNFSVAVWVGYIACFGLATENGLVMLVYLREAIEERGGLAKMTLEEVREAVMQGAVHRTRPKALDRTHHDGRPGSHAVGHRHGVRNHPADGGAGARRHSRFRRSRRSAASGVVLSRASLAMAPHSWQMPALTGGPLPRLATWKRLLLA